MFGTEYAGKYWGYFIVCSVTWWVVASLLLFLTWNKVVAVIANIKTVKFWHAMLVVATLAVFCAPRYYGKKHFRGGHHGYGKYQKCPGGLKGEKCPFYEEMKQKWMEGQKEAE